MLHHTRPQLHLAAHRGLGPSTLTHLFAADVVRRRMLAAARTAAVARSAFGLRTAQPRPA
jgi:hypothetical protein